MKCRWKWIICILAILTLSATFLLTTLNRRWEHDFLQALKATKSGEGTFYDNVGNWSTTRIYDVQTSYSEVVEHLEKEMDRSQIVRLVFDLEAMVVALNIPTVVGSSLAVVVVLESAH